LEACFCGRAAAGAPDPAKKKSTKLTKKKSKEKHIQNNTAAVVVVFGIFFKNNALRFTTRTQAKSVKGKQMQPRNKKN